MLELCKKKKKILPKRFNKNVLGINFMKTNVNMLYVNLFMLIFLLQYIVKDVYFYFIWKTSQINCEC